jgi:teichuronic acid biosynthesis glycosyltransferase TuaC
MPRRRIALVTPILPMPYDQTRGRFIYETAKSLSKLADVKVFLPQARYPKISWLLPRSYVYGDLAESYSLAELDVDAFSYTALPLVSRGLNSLVSSRHLTPKIRAFKPDVVIGYWVYPDGHAALRSARALGVPCVIGALGSDIHVRQGINTLMTRHTLKQSDAVIVVSDAMRQYTTERYGTSGDKIHVIVNGFNTAVFQSRDKQIARSSLGIPKDSEVISYVGRFIEAKGLIELVTSFGKMILTRPHLRLALIGSGVLEERLKTLLHENKLLDKVFMPGGLQPTQVAQWLAASDVLTLPSWSEGYPNVVLEGVACGRPVVATDVGGTSEIIHNGNGILIPPKNIDALTRALIQALDTTWDHDAIAKGIRRSWDDVASETMTVCESLIQSHRRK